MRLLLPFIIVLFLAACNNNSPDVSNIKVDLPVERYDKLVYSIDTNNVADGLKKVYVQQPGFTNAFIAQVLQLHEPYSDTSKILQEAMRSFLTHTQQLKDSVWQKFDKNTEWTKGVENGLKYVKYYFPQYKLPKLIGFIGDLTGREILTQDGLAIGLDYYMGKDFSYYLIPEVQTQIPTYLSRRFSVEYLPTNCMQAVIDDLYPDTSFSKPLIEQMVEKGKRYFVLDKFLPKTNDTLKLQYTKDQLNWCYKNEKDIWKFFLDGDLLYSTDPSTSNFVSEGPSTQGMPQDSPGNIGLFVGWRIVQKYVEKHPDITIQQLMKTSSKEIFNAAKYKPS
ncbi:MAG: hypothetical protein HYR66_12155 [Sphingobacteriales bacterium]|nr:hypothetical protein [Sphingobacteriales bacterium]MBI3720178.1 hypothetical protein [Sphingobacteriales bacterium]